MNDFDALGFTCDECGGWYGWNSHAGGDKTKRICESCVLIFDEIEMETESTVALIETMPYDRRLPEGTP